MKNVSQFFPVYIPLNPFLVLNAYLQPSSSDLYYCAALPGITKPFGVNSVGQAMHPLCMHGIYPIPSYDKTCILGSCSHS